MRGYSKNPCEARVANLPPLSTYGFMLSSCQNRLFTISLYENLFKTRIISKFLQYFPTFLMTVTWPKYPADPLSTKGTSAAKHIRFTWFLAAKRKAQTEIFSWSLRDIDSNYLTNSSEKTFVVPSVFIYLPFLPSV